MKYRKKKCQTGGLITPTSPISNTYVAPRPLLRMKNDTIASFKQEIMNSILPQLPTLPMAPTESYFSDIRHVGFESSGKVKSKDRFHEKSKGGLLSYQSGGNIQKLDNITFDSNKARQGEYGQLIVTDQATKKDYGVVRKENGTYEFWNPNDKIGFYESFNPKNWGVADRSQVTEFTDAFNLSKSRGDKEFYWRDKRYAVKDVDPSIKNAVEVARQQVMENIRDKKNRIQYTPTALDTMEAIYNKNAPISNKEEMQYWSTAIDPVTGKRRPGILPPTAQSTLDSIITEKEKEQHEYYDKKMSRVKGVKPIITSQKGKETATGYVKQEDRSNPKFFVFGRDSLSAVGTARHEFEHVAQDYKDYEGIDNDYKKILSMANKNTRFKRYYGQEQFDYLSSPFEIGARFVNLNTLMKERKLKSLNEVYDWSKKNRKIATNNTSYISRLKGFDDTDPFFDVHQLLDLYDTDRGLLEKHFKQYMSPVESKQYGGDIVSQLGYQDNSPFKNAPQLTINSPSISMENVSQPLLGIADTGETKLMQPNMKYKFKNASSVTEMPLSYASGGIHINPKNKGKFTAAAKRAGHSVQEHARAVLRDPNASPLQKKRANFARNAAKWHHNTGGILGDLSTLLGTINPIIGAAGAVIPAIASIFKGPDKTVVSASPGNYQNGGDIPLSSSSFQVKGNPSVTDGNNYGNVALDHNEVITKTQQGQFVYSDDLKHSSGVSFAKLAAQHEKAKGKAEAILKVTPYDEQAKSTISQSNAILEQIANEQEALATSMGLREQDGSTKQNYQTGGPVYMQLPNNPNYYYDPYEGVVRRRDPSTGKYSAYAMNANQLDMYRPQQSEIDKHLKQYPGPTPKAPLLSKDTGSIYDQTRPATTDPVFQPTLPTPQPPYRRTDDVLNERLFGEPEAKQVPIAPIPPTAPKRTGKAAPKKSTSTLPRWLTEGRDFMKQLDETTPYSDRPELGSVTGLPTSTPPIQTADQRAAISNPNFEAQRTFYEEEPDTPFQSGLDANTAVTTTTQDQRYKTPWTFGDTLKAFELGAKGIGAFGRAEKEKPLLDRTPITQEAFDPTNALYQSQRQFQNFANTAPATSVNMRRALLNSALASKYGADQSIVSQYDTMNKQARTSFQDRLSNQQRFNAQSQFRTNEINAANRAAQDMTQQNFFTSIGQFGEDLNRKRYASDVINLFQTQYPDVFQSYIKTIQNG